ncbi:MAG: sensor domain-containing diguanylate cyclase [Burkholderiaceae bacterium]|nr:MAG: sensor domain-containing diguanylate cyclase [Burkholderiaceae bacterium]
MQTLRAQPQTTERMLVTTSLVYTVSVLVLLIFAQQGRLALAEVFYYGCAAATTLAAFCILQRRRAHAAPDTHLQYAQAIVALLLHGVFVLRLPQLAFLFALNAQVIMILSALQFSLKRYALLWLLTAVGSGCIVTWIGAQTAGGPVNLKATLDWLYFVVTTACLSFVGERIAYLRDIVRERNRNMSATLNRYRQLLSHDELTHALSRRFFMDILEQHVAQAERFDTGFCVAMIDLDHFKRVNDRYGHPIGDAVLCTVCEAAWATLRQVDQIGRYGGEEFAVLLPQCRVEDALTVLQRVRINISMTKLEHLAPGLRMTISIGVTEYRKGDHVHGLLERADQALYQAKNAGRNQIRTLCPDAEETA